MLTKGAHHVALDVKDIARSRLFYGDLLGLSEIDRPDFGLPGVWYQAGPVQLHLIQVPEDLDVGHPPMAPTPLAHHIAFAVEATDSVKLELESAGYQVIAIGSEAKQIFVPDPDGNIIEFIES